MLQDFLTRERNSILTAARQKAAEAKWAPLVSVEAETQWTKLYDRFASIVSSVVGNGAHPPEDDHDPLQLGFAVSEIVQTYAIIYRAVTESAAELGYTISAEEYYQLKLSLDTAISDVVNEYERTRSLAQRARTDRNEREEGERLGFLVHELRNSLQSATLAFEVMETGAIEPDGSTAEIVKRHLLRMNNLIDTAVTSVRLKLEPDLHLERVSVGELMNDVSVTASFVARSRNQTIQLQTVATPYVLCDKALLVSAVSNLVQNALKFTDEGGTIWSRTMMREDLAVIEIEDQCGGIDDSKIEQLFLPGVQKSADRSGLGLGLTISRSAIERNNGEISVTNLPGKGCIFRITLPVAP